MAQTSRVVIGLDFGTTYSGIAYCDDTSAREGVAGIQVVTAWPSVSGQGANEKTPSRIAYGPPPDVEILWGSQIGHKCKYAVHACMKLKLDEKMKRSPQFLQLLAFLTSRIEGIDVNDILNDEDDGAEPPAYPGKDPVDMVADYLTKLRENAWVELTKRYGAELFGTMRKELVITVPAVWSERAKDLTTKAVVRANFGADRLAMVTEPEAAAVYTLKGMLEGPNKDEVKVGNVFVLCDAGGGTVDLISYKITQVRPKLLIEEAAVGSGDKCGASYVDKEFLAWLEDWIGTDRYKKIKEDKTRHGSQLMNFFEAHKWEFNGTQDDLEIPLPSDCGIDDDAELNIDDRVLSLKNDQMKQVFDPCVNRTLELIDGQVASVMKAGHGRPKMVLVVGGFGKNVYLYKKIEEYCEKRSIVVRQPRSPWSAVARGAVCRGLEGPGQGVIIVRLARRFYGAAASEPWNARIHHPDDMYVDELTGGKYASGQMTWLCDKGDRLPESSPRTISLDVCKHFEASDERECGAQLFGCEGDVAPRRAQDDSVHVVCRVKANFGDIPLSRFPKSMNMVTGKEYYEISFRLQATFLENQIAWKLLYEGREYGSTTVSYDA